MKERSAIVAALVPFALVASLSAAQSQPTFRVVNDMNGYQYPSGLLEGAPGVFYASATISGTSQSAAMSIAPQGAIVTLGTLPAMYNILSNFVAGADGRFYAGVEYSSYPGYAYSVSSAPGSGKSYPPQDFFPLFRQSLPDARFLATGGGGSGSSLFLETVDEQGVVKPIYQFPPNVRPLSAIRGSDGSYYGIVATQNSPVGYVFKVTPSGVGTVFFNFPPNSFSTWDPAPLVQALNGDFYGALPSGGANHRGLIFRLTADGQYTTLYTFPTTDNGDPTSLILASDGHLYGTAANFGGNSYIFSVTPAGQYTMLYSMNTNDGICSCSLTQGSDGVIYGTAAAGGPHAGGTMFALGVGLPKPRPQALELAPPSGPAGTRVSIWGYNLLGPSSVQFNGVAATSVTGSGPQYVLATVPAGATSGPVTVTTPGGVSTTVGSFHAE